MGGVNATYCKPCHAYLRIPIPASLIRNGLVPQRSPGLHFPEWPTDWQNGRMVEWASAPEADPSLPPSRVPLTCYTPHALSSLHTLPGQVAPGTAGRDGSGRTLAPQAPQGETERSQAAACLLERCDSAIDREVKVRKIPNESTHEFIPASPTHVPKTLAT